MSYAPHGEGRREIEGKGNTSGIRPGGTGLRCAWMVLIQVIEGHSSLRQFRFNVFFAAADLLRLRPKA